MHQFSCHDNKLFRNMGCLFSSRSAEGSHGEGLCLQSHSLVSCRRPLCTPSRNHHYVCQHQAKDFPCWDKPEFPSSPHLPPTTLDYRLSPAHKPKIHSQIFLDSQWCPDVQEHENPMAPASSQAQGNPEQAPAFPCLRLLPSPPPPSLVVLQCFPIGQHPCPISGTQSNSPHSASPSNYALWWSVCRPKTLQALVKL